MTTKTVTELKNGRSRREKLREKLKEFEKIKNSESASEIKSILREQETKSSLSDAVSLLNENIVENKELSEKIDYLMNLLLDAADSMGEDSDSIELIEAIARSQVEVLERIGKVDNAIGSSKSDMVNVVDKKLDQIIKYLEVENKDIAKITSDVEEFKGLLNFDKLDSEITTIKSAISKIQTEMDLFETNLVEETESGEHLAKIDVLKKTVTELDSKLESLNTELKGVIPSIYKTESLQGDLTIVKTKLEDLDSKLFENFGELEANVSNELKKFQEEIADVSSQLQKNEGSVESLDLLKTQITALFNKFSSFSSQVKNRKDLSELFAYEIQELETHFDKLESKMNDIEDDVLSSIKTSATPAVDSSDLVNIKKALEELTKELHTTEQVVKSNKDLAGYFNSQVKTIKMELNGVSKELNDIKKDSSLNGVDALSKNVASVLVKLKDLEADIYHGQLSSNELKSRLEDIDSNFKSFESSEDSRVLKITDRLKEVEKRFIEMESHLGSSKAIVSKHDLDEARKAVRSLKSQISNVSMNNNISKHLADAKLNLKKEQVSLKSGSTKVSNGFGDSLSGLKAQLLGVKQQAHDVKSIKVGVAQQLSELKDSVKLVEKSTHPEIVSKSKPQIEMLLAKIDANKKNLVKDKTGDVATHILRVEKKADVVKGHLEEKKNSSQLKKAELSVKKADFNAKFGGVTEKEYNKVYDTIKALESGKKISARRISISAGVSVPSTKKAIRSIVGRKDVLAKIQNDSFLHKLIGKEMIIKRL